MKTLYVTIGVPCSGKTTWAKEQGIAMVSRDTERLSIFGEYRMGNRKEEDTITKIVEYKVKQLLRIGHVDLDLVNGLEWESVHYSTKEITKYKLKFLAN